jgi:hypothetical protein
MKENIPKNTVIWIAFFAIVVLNLAEASGQDWAKKMFRETGHDFGNVAKGELPEFRFEFQNLYQEDVIIERVATSCPCIIATLADNKNVLKTYEKGAVICKFNSPAFDGQRKATITVRFARPFVAEVQLNLSGNIIKGVSFTPDTIDFGQVIESNLPTKQIRLTSSGDPSFRVVDVKSTFPHIGVQMRETSRNSTLVTYDLSIRLKSTVPAGFTQGELYVIAQEGNVTRQIPIKFNVKLVGSLQLPESISLGPVPIGEVATRKVILKSDQEFRVTDVTCSNSAFRVKANNQVKKVQFVEVMYRAPDQPGQYEEELTFYIDNLQDPAGKLKVFVEAVDETKPAVVEK